MRDADHAVRPDERDRRAVRDLHRQHGPGSRGHRRVGVETGSPAGLGDPDDRGAVHLVHPCPGQVDHGTPARVEVCPRRGDRQVAVRDRGGDDVGAAGARLQLEDEP